MPKLNVVRFHFGHGHFGLRKALFARHAEFALRHGELPPGQLAFFPNKLAFVACNLQTVRARALTRRGDERARRTVRVLGVSRHFVLNLNVVPMAVLAVAHHAIRHAEDPLPQVKLMWALVQQHAAAFACPRRTPRAAVVVCLRAVPVRDDPNAAFQFAQLAALHDLAHFLELRVRALIVHDAEHLARFFRGRIHFLHLLRVNAGRLLRQHVLALFKSIDRNGGVEVMRCRHDHRVTHTAVDHFLVVFIARYAGQIFVRPKAFRFRNIAHGGKLHAFDITGENALCVRRTHVADADNADLYCFAHKIAFFLLSDGFQNIVQRVGSHIKRFVRVFIYALMQNVLALQVLQAAEIVQMRLQRQHVRLTRFRQRF